MDVKISYETLFDLLRREKNREELQPLEDSFFKDVREYIRQKQAVLQGAPGSMFGDKEQDSVRMQLDNIQKILRELFERRENKIVRLSQDMGKSGLSGAVDLLPEEQEFYHSLGTMFKKHKERIQKLLTNQEPSVQAPKQPTTYAESRPEKLAAKGSTEDASAEEPEEDATEKAPIASANLKVRFLNPLPRFLGPSKEILGPFDQDEEAELPARIAHLLIRKGRAEEA